MAPTQMPIPPVPYPPGSKRSVTTATTSPTYNFSTSSLLSKVLQQRQIQRADQLFSIPDYEIITELHSALTRIKHIFNDHNYVENSNDQSVVELALARITAAIRETCSMETYAPALVDVLDSCLSHKMYIISSGGQIHDSPHCRIASELLSSLFLYHSKKSVMTVAIPVAIKALSSANHELVRSTSSYLSLAAIHNGKLLAQYAIQIISNIINGNYSLVRVLPQVYPENREPFHAHLSPLFRLLGLSALDTSEKLSLLQLASMVANYKPDLIIPHLLEFEEFLQSQTTCTAVLHIYLSLISKGRVEALINQLLPIKRALRKNAPSQNNLTTMAKVIGHIGKTGGDMACLAIPDLIELCNKSNTQNLPILLKEIESVVEAYPASVQHHLDIIKELSERQGTNYSVFKRIRALSLEDKKRSSGKLIDPSSNEEIYLSTATTTTKNPNSNSRSRNSGFESIESLQSKRSSRIFPNDPIHHSNSSNVPPTTIFNINEGNTYLSSAIGISSCAVGASDAAGATGVGSSSTKARDIGELDRNMKHLADLYKMRSSGSLGHHPKTPSYNNIGQSKVAEGVDDKPDRNSLYASNKPSSPQPQQPSPTSYQMALLSTPIAIGKDGRVRPLSNTRARPNITQKPSNLSPPTLSYETTFPVGDVSPITTTSSTTNINSKLPPKSSSHPRSSHSIHTSSTTPTKHKSTDTVGRSTIKTGTSSDWDLERGDVVKQFVANRRSKIRRYIQDFTSKYPIPLKCTVEAAKSSKARMKIYFVCQLREHQYCLHATNETLFVFKTSIPAVWLHLMFLQAEVSSIESANKVLTQESEEFKTLANCWNTLGKDFTKNREFVTLVTSAFPTIKEQTLILKELQEARYFDDFSFNPNLHKWSCFTCAHPEKVKSLIKSDNSNMPLLEGQLKEKRGKWKFFKRWHTKYFTLSSAALTYSENTYNTVNERTVNPSIDLRKIRSVKSLTRGRQSRKSLPKSFEIFTEDEKSYVLKASDRNKAEEWFQCLQIAIAKAQNDRRTQSFKK